MQIFDQEGHKLISAERHGAHPRKLETIRAQFRVLLYDSFDRMNHSFIVQMLRARIKGRLPEEDMLIAEEGEVRLHKYVWKGEVVLVCEAEGADEASGRSYEYEVPFVHDWSRT